MSSSFYPLLESPVPATMDSAGFAFSVLGTAQLCFTLGQKIRSVYNTYHHAQDELDRRILAMQHSTMKIEYQAATLERIWDDLDPRLQMIQNLVLQEYHFILQKSVTKLDSFLNQHDTIRKVKFSLVGSHLDELLGELERWGRRYDPSWFLIARTSAVILDTSILLQEGDHQQAPSHLQEAENAQKNLLWLRHAHNAARDVSGSDLIFLDPQIVSGPRRQLKRSSVRMMERPSDGRLLLVETRSTLAGQGSAETLTSDVEDFVRCFRDADPDAVGILPCMGAVRVPAQQASPFSFELIFEAPENLRQPRSLRQILTDSGPVSSLTDRVQLATLLARSLLTVHEARFLHKNISPETIVVFRESGNTTYGTPFLMGFEMFRSDLGRSVHAGDNLPEKNLYRHPQRQGKLIETDYIIQHDMYSLGVCLLELGLFSSFVRWPKGSQNAEPGDIIKNAGLMSIKDPGKLAVKTKALFVDLAETRLPAAVGQKYADVVLACLTCLDDEKNNLFGDVADFQDQDGILVGVRYIEKVLLQLEAISL